MVHYSLAWLFHYTDQYIGRLCRQRFSTPARACASHEEDDALDTRGVSNVLDPVTGHDDYVVNAFILYRDEHWRSCSDGRVG